MSIPRFFPYTFKLLIILKKYEQGVGEQLRGHAGLHFVGMLVHHGAAGVFSMVRKLMSDNIAAQLVFAPQSSRQHIFRDPYTATVGSAAQVTFEFFLCCLGS